MSSIAVRRSIVRLGFGIAASSLLTLGAYRFHFNLSAATSLHLFLIAVIALRWGFLEASMTSLVSVACLDYFFTEPLFHFYISDSHDWLALGTFESVAVLVSRLSAQVNRHAKEAETHQKQLQRLYELSQNILLLDFQWAIEEKLVIHLQQALAAKSVAIWNAYDLRLSKYGYSEFSEEELRATLLSASNADEWEQARSRRVLRSGTRSIGSFLIEGHTADAASINAAASLVSIAMERARSFKTASSAEAERQSEQLRAAVLDALAHAYKTPLTAIQTSSSGLLEMNTLPPAEMRLVSLIDRQVTHLNEITTQLLRTAKFDSAALKLKQHDMDLAELARESVAESREHLAIPNIQLTLSDRPTRAFADKHLVKMALMQLLDNAAKYGSAETSIDVQVWVEKEESVVSVFNQGSFIAVEERTKIFKRFYRSPEMAHKASGTGIGLSVVRQIVEAHQGRVWVTSDQNVGTTFFLAFPQKGL